MRGLLVVFALAAGTACTAIDYAHVESMRAGEVATGLDRLDGRRVAVLDIRVPEDILEHNLGLRLWLEESLLRALHASGARVFLPSAPSRVHHESKVVQNEMFNWFFKSESYSRDTREETVLLSDLDAFVVLNVLDYRRGTLRENSWVRFNVQIHAAATRELEDVVFVEGFYDSAMRAMEQAGR